MRNLSLTDARVFAPSDFRRWVLGGLLLTIAGYLTLVVIGWWQFGFRAGIGSNIVATAVCVCALVLAARSREVAGAALAMAATWIEVQNGFLTSSRFPEGGLMVLPVLIIALGLVLGTRTALVATVITVVTTWVAVRLSPIMRETGLSPDDTYWLVLYTVIMVVAWALLALSLTGFGRVYRELIANQRELADTIRSSPDGILVLDGADSVLLANPAAEAVLGVPASQLIGRRVADVFGPDVGNPGRDAILSRDTAEAPVLLHITPRDGRHIHVEATWRRMEGDRRQLLLHNVTERVRAEDQRRAIEGQLAHAQRLEAVGQLAGGLSHDFNNILMAVGGSADLLRSEPNASEREALIDDIIAARDRGAALTRQLLAFARRDVVQPRIIDLGAHVRSLERLLRRVAGERQRLHFDLAPGCNVRVDVGQLEQSLVNLVSNARDAMPEGGRCTVSVMRVVDGTGAFRVHLEVADEGIGMTGEVAARAFEPFFTTKPRGQGTGLGLASVHSLTSQCGGTARIESTLGRGTTVTLELPHVAEAATPVEVVAQEESTPDARFTILVAEDDQGTRTIVERILRHAGLNVVVARDGAEALGVVETGEVRIDLLLTDLMMPRLTGPALAERVRALFPRLPVLFMTGYAEDTVRDLGSVSFDRDVISKPFSGDALTARVEELLRVTAHPVPHPG